MNRLLKFIGLVVCLLVGSSPGLSQVGSLSGQVIDQHGTPVPNPLIRVCNAAASTGTPCTPTVPIYADYGLQQPIANPAAGDIYGNYTFFVPALPAPNLYTIQFSPDSGITWQYTHDGPVNGAPTIQACNQVGADAGAQMIAAAAKLPVGGGMIDATCYGATEQTVGEQLTALAGKSINLNVNPATRFDLNFAFSSGLIAASVATGNSGLNGACLVPIGAGSSITTFGFNQPPPSFGYWHLGPNAATYDVFCNATQDGTQESMSINGLGIIGNVNATMSGSLLHLRRLFVSTLIENVVTYNPYGNAVTDDGGSDHFFINDNFNDSGGSTQQYAGAVLTLNCPTNFTMIGGAVQFNGPYNPLFVINGSDPQLAECPLGTSGRGIKLYSVDFETSAATIGSFPGAATNVDPLQFTDSGFIWIDNMQQYGNCSTSQNHFVDLLSTGNNGQLRGPVELNNIAVGNCFVGKSIIHNANGAPYVSPAQADVFGTQNDASLTIGEYKWEGNGAANASSIDYEDVKNFTSATTGFLISTNTNGVMNAAQYPGADIGAQVNAAIAATASGTGINGYGVVQLPPGNYSYATTISLANYPNIMLDCQGANLTYTGSTIGVDALQPLGQLYSTGGIENCNLYSPSTAIANVTAFRWGNVLGYKIQHDSAWNFDTTGDIAFLAENTVYFTEDSVVNDNQARSDTIAYQMQTACAAGATQCTRSFEYTWFKNNYWNSPYNAVTGTLPIGLNLIDAQLQNSSVELHANVNGPTGGDVVSVDAASQVLRDQIAIQAEPDISPTTAICVANQGSFYASGQLQCDAMANSGNPVIFFGADFGYVGGDFPLNNYASGAAVIYGSTTGNSSNLLPDSEDQLGNTYWQPTTGNFTVGHSMLNTGHTDYGYINTGAPQTCISGTIVSQPITLPAGTYTISAAENDGTTTTTGCTNPFMGLSVYTGGGVTDIANQYGYKNWNAPGTATFTLATATAITFEMSFLNTNFPTGAYVYWWAPQIEQGNTMTAYKQSLLGGAPSKIPVVATPTAGQTACIKSVGPPVQIGYCSSVVGSGGGCTCN